MTGSKQQAPSLLRLTSSLHRTIGQCDIRNSVDNVSLTQPVRCPRALSPVLLLNAAGDPRPKVLAKYYGQSSLQRESGGFWESWEQQDIIDLKQLRAATKGMEQNVDQLQGKRIRLFQDNTVVVSCLRKFSSRCKPIMHEIYKVVPWLQLHRISLDVVYIRSEFNLADPASRRRGADL